MPPPSLHALSPTCSLGDTWHPSVTRGRYDEPLPYNDLLHALKAELTGVKAPIWRYIVQEANLSPGLIISAENEDSDVDLATAAAFWVVGAGAPAPEVGPTQDVPEDEDSDLDGLE